MSQRETTTEGPLINVANKAAQASNYYLCLIISQVRLTSESDIISVHIVIQFMTCQYYIKPSFLGWDKTRALTVFVESNHL